MAGRCALQRHDWLSGSREHRMSPGLTIVVANV
jgi:hypothetical protein